MIHALSNRLGIPPRWTHVLVACYVCVRATVVTSVLFFLGVRLHCTIAGAIAAIMVPHILWYLWRVVWIDKGPVQSHQRSAALALVNLWELIVVFAILYLGSGAVVENTPARTILGNPRDALYFSAVTTMTVGYGDFVPTGSARYIVVAQLVTQAIFLFILLPALVATKRVEQGSGRL